VGEHVLAGGEDESAEHEVGVPEPEEGVGEDNGDPMSCRIPKATTPIRKTRKTPVRIIPHARILNPRARYFAKSLHPVRLVLTRLMASETPTRNRKRPAVTSAKTAQFPEVLSTL